MCLVVAAIVSDQLYTFYLQWHLITRKSARRIGNHGQHFHSFGYFWCSRVTQWYWNEVICQTVSHNSWFILRPGHRCAFIHDKFTESVNYEATIKMSENRCKYPRNTTNCILEENLATAAPAILSSDFYKAFPPIGKEYLIIIINNYCNSSIYHLLLTFIIQTIK